MASRGFSRAAAPVWGFSRGMTGSSGSLSCGAREVKSPCAWRGGARHFSPVMVGESGLKTREGLSRFFRRVPAELGEESQASSRGEAKDTAILSSCDAWKGFPAFPAHLRMRPVSRGHCRQILYHLSHQGNPRILDWVADPFCKGASVVSVSVQSYGL